MLAAHVSSLHVACSFLLSFCRGGGYEVVSSLMATDSCDHVVDLESVITTEELNRRPARAPDHAAENAALVDLARTLAASPKDILKKLSETALDLCRAQSAGISLLNADGK